MSTAAAYRDRASRRGRRESAARAGLAPEVLTATTSGSRSRMAGITNEQRSGSVDRIQPDSGRTGLTAIAPGEPDRRSRRTRARRRRGPRGGRRAARRAPTASQPPVPSRVPMRVATTVTRAPAASSCSTLRAAMAPAPTETGPSCEVDQNRQVAWRGPRQHRRSAAARAARSAMRPRRQDGMRRRCPVWTDLPTLLASRIASTVVPVLPRDAAELRLAGLHRGRPPSCGSSSRCSPSGFMLATPS